MKVDVESAHAPRTVTELTEELRRLLEECYEWVQVRGEISNYKKAPSGHVYFRLKDDGAVLECVAWKSTVARWAGLELEDGIEVIAGGQLTLYPPRGQYQLVVSAIRLAGIGALQKRFEMLKQKLMADGLFEMERKRPLPSMLHRVAVITSPSGAAVQDFLRILRNNRCPVSVTVCPVLVQGAEAAGEISAMFRTVNRLARFDLIVLCRGGGSLEDLWPFNEEIVARAIAESRIPVVTGIGHEVDFTIADFVADFRSPTPTAAAQVICDILQEHRAQLQICMDRLLRCMVPRIERERERIEVLRKALRRYHPMSVMAMSRQRLDDFHLTLMRKMNGVLKDHRERHNESQKRLLRGARHEVRCLQQEMKQKEALLRSLNPRQILSRGYAICRRADGQAITHASHVKEQDTILVNMQDGVLQSQVLKVYLDS